VELFLGRLPPGVAERIFGFGFHLWLAKPKYYMGSDEERNSPFVVGGDIDAFLRQRAYEIDHVPCTLDAGVCCLEATMVGRRRALVRTLTWQSAPLLGLRDIDPNARFPITDREGVERWHSWAPEGFWAYRERFWPLLHSRLLDSPPPARLPDGRRRPVELHLRDPQGFLRHWENNSWVDSDQDSEHSSDADEE
jgi:hypothetical protein